MNLGTRTLVVVGATVALAVAGGCSDQSLDKPVEPVNSEDSSAIPVGMRMKTIRVNDVNDVAGSVFPEDRVDVILNAPQGDKTSSRVVVENLEVAAINLLST